MRRVLAALAVALAAGCLQRLDPDIGPLAHAPCANDDSDPSTRVSFAADVHDGLFKTSHCLGCHTPTGKTPIGLEVGGLDLSTYDTLIAGGRQSGAQIVVPGQPCESVLVQKLGEAPPFGARMPLAGPPFLTDDQLQVVADWIAEGADDD